MAVNEFGVADIRTFYQAWIIEDPQFNRLCLRHLNYRIFSGAWDADLVPSASWLLSWGRLTGGSTSKKVPQGSALALCLGELLCPMLPAALSLPQETARAEFTAGVWNLICHDSAATVSEFNHIDFIRWVGTMYDADRVDLLRLLRDAARIEPGAPQGAEDVGAAVPPVAPQQLGAGINPQLRPQGPYAGLQPGQVAGGIPMVPDPFTIRQDRFTFEIAYYVLMYLASKTVREARIGGVDILTNVYAAVMKRGNMSEKFKTKVEQGVYDDLNVQTILNIPACKVFYSRFGQYINAQNIATVVAHWTGLMPVKALRLRLVVQQAANSGLTALICIGTAMRLYPDFDWSMISRIMPVDVRNFHAAVATVDGDIYYGFNQDLGNVKSTLYKNLTYPAKELLMKVGGKGSLGQYGGWPRVVPHQALIDRKIADYETALGARIANENAGGPVIDYMQTEMLAPIKELIDASPGLFTI